MNTIPGTIRVARVTSIEDLSKEGVIKAKLLGEGTNEEKHDIFYTSPFQSPPDGEENSKFTGFTGMPGKNAYILVCENPDDYKWYYIASISGNSYSRLVEEEEGQTSGKGEAAFTRESLPFPVPKQTITGNADGEFNSAFAGAENPDTDTYSHGHTPGKYTFESPKGGKFQISDSAAPEDLQYFTKMESMTKKKVIADDVNDYIAIENEDGDGLKITSQFYNRKIIPAPGPGPNSAQLQAKQNIFIEADGGSLNAQVKGGYQLNIQNESVNIPATRPIPIDTKVGEVNVESYANSVNIRTLGKEWLTQGNVVPPSPGAKGVFIDASQYQGVVQIKAGKGGVEIFSQGDIDFNCNGNFNVNAAGSINLKAASTRATTYWNTVFNPAEPLAGTGIGVPGLINLNPGEAVGKYGPTLNNEEQYLNGIG